MTLQTVNNSMYYTPIEGKKRSLWNLWENIAAHIGQCVLQQYTITTQSEWKFRNSISGYIYPGQKQTNPYIYPDFL